MNAIKPKLCWYSAPVLLICSAITAGCSNSSRLFNLSGYSSADAYDAQILLLTDDVSRPVEIFLDEESVGTVHRDEVLKIGVDTGSYLVRSNQISSFPVNIALSTGQVINIVVTDTPKGLFFRSVPDMEFNVLREGKYLIDVSAL